MNEDIVKFVGELKNKPEVLGVVIFGSWARGNNRPNSDVDLLVIQKEGFRRAVEYTGEQAFEIIYTTPELALKFWNENKDDCVGLWSVAKILYDKDGTIMKLQSEAEAIIKEGKKPIDASQREQYRFSAMDEISAAESMLASDVATANILLNHVVFTMTGLFFDLRQMWVPAPKQRLEKIKELSPALHSALNQFHLAEASIQDKFKLAKEIVSLTFENVS